LDRKGKELVLNPALFSFNKKSILLIDGFVIFGTICKEEGAI